MKMPVPYFDKKENTPGGISSKLATDAYQIHNMITGVISVICLNFSTVFASLAVAFYGSWQITLIALAFSPALIISSSLHIKIFKSLALKSESGEKFINSLISDTVSNIRTVKSFGSTKYFIQKFKEKMEELNTIAFERAVKVSFFQGMRRALLIVIEGVVFWLAGVLYQFDYIRDDTSIFLAIFGIIYAASTVGSNSQYMPDIVKAKKAALALFNILEAKDE